MAEQKPRIDGVDDDTEVTVTLQLLLPGHLLKTILKAPYKGTTGRLMENDSVADAVRWCIRDCFADDDFETVQKSATEHVEGIDRPHYADYQDQAAYERAKARWRGTMKMLGYDPNDLPLFSTDDAP